MLQEVLLTIVTAVMGIAVKYLRSWVNANKEHLKEQQLLNAYEHKNNRIERVLSNAVSYSMLNLEKYQKVDPTWTEISVGVDYIKTVTHDIFDNIGEVKLEVMLQRKQQQVKDNLKASHLVI